MINVLIIEDESHCVDWIRKLLDKFSKNIRILGDFDNISDAIKAINSIDVDLVFMDVILKDGNCFDLLKKIKTLKFEIIFTTAHNDFAIKAFDYSALHYLLKPIDSDKFDEAVNRAIGKVDLKKTNQKIETIFHNLEVHSFDDKKIAIPSTKGYIFCKVGNIIRIEADGNYCNIHLINGKQYMSTKQLKYYEYLLDKRLFFRVHQSHLINLAYVNQYINFNKKSFLLFNDGKKVPVSVRKRTEFLNCLSKNKQL